MISEIIGLWAVTGRAGRAWPVFRRLCQWAVL